MKLLIGFSGRRGGNCDQIAEYAAAEGDRIVYFRDMKAHPCSGCDYECFSGACRYRPDGVYDLYEAMHGCEKVVLIVPMYCGNPSSLYFIFNERGQDYFSHSDVWDDIVKRLYVIGVYGSARITPGFVPCLGKWFEGTPYKNRVLGVERHRNGQRIGDRVLDVEEFRREIKAFLE